MPRRQEERQVGKATAEALESVEHGRVLAAMRAAGNPDEVAFSEPEQALPDGLAARLRGRQVGLEIAGDHHPLG